MIGPDFGVLKLFHSIQHRLFWIFHLNEYCSEKIDGVYARRLSWNIVKQQAAQAHHKNYNPLFMIRFHLVFIYFYIRLLHENWTELIIT